MDSARVGFCAVGKILFSDMPAHTHLSLSLFLCQEEAQISIFPLGHFFALHGIRNYVIDFVFSCVKCDLNFFVYSMLLKGLLVGPFVFEESAASLLCTRASLRAAYRELASALSVFRMFTRNARALCLHAHSLRCLQKRPLQLFII